jgi:hypothetical protein
MSASTATADPTDEAWKEIQANLKQLEQKLAKLRQLEHAFYTEDASCFEEVIKLRNQLKYYRKSRRFSSLIKTTAPITPHLKAIAELSKKIDQLEQQFHRKPRLFLTSALGSASFTMDSKHRLQYKTEYENFKLRMTILHIVVCIVNLWLWPVALMDTLFDFLRLYYYSTVTLREHILLVNGSNIREWWLIHHYLSMFLSVVLLMWPPGPAFYTFRTQFYYFSTCTSIVQLLQFRYQMERLYTLRALSKVGPMDVTTDAASIHLRSLVFLLPFLLLVQLFEIYNGYTLFRLTQTPDGHLWQVWICSLLFAFLGLGNLTMTLLIYFEKTYTMLKRRRLHLA